MNSKIIDQKLLESDIRSAVCKARSIKQRIKKSHSENDIFPYIEQIFATQGYEFKISGKQQMFNIVVSPNVTVTGQVDNGYICLGLTIRFDGLVVNDYVAGSGRVKFLISELDFLFLPLIDKMISECVALNKKYVELRKKEMMAELLEPLVCEHLKDMRNIYIRPDEAGIIWMLKNINDNMLVRVPIDFDNYKSQCDAWLKVVNNEELWKIEHKDTKVQVLKIDNSYGARPTLINMATNEWYYNLKL